MFKKGTYSVRFSGNLRKSIKYSVKGLGFGETRYSVFGKSSGMLLDSCPTV